MVQEVEMHSVDTREEPSWATNLGGRRPIGRSLSRPIILPFLHPQINIARTSADLLCPAFTPSRRAQTSNNAVESRPNSTRAAGAGGSSNTMLRIYTDDNKGLSVWVFQQSHSFSAFLCSSKMMRLARAKRLTFLSPSMTRRDPVIVLVLAVSFVFSVVCLHVIGKVARIFFK